MTPLVDSFENDLKQWGPDFVRSPASAPPAAPTLSEAQAYCRSLATSHYENFAVVSWLLPKSLHQHFFNVYSYCRWADDLGDEVGDRDLALSLLKWWRTELDDCYAGATRHPVFVALKPTLAEFQIPKKPFADLVSAFEQDQHVVAYETAERLLDYCQSSANPVGHLVLYLGKAASPENFALADKICTGLQLANFWQDVARDADIGRRYLPLADMSRFGYSVEDYNARRATPEFVELMRHLVQQARGLLQEGHPLVQRVPRALQVDIDLFARGGLKILEKIEAAGYRVWDQRPKVTKFDAAKLLVRSIVRCRILGWTSRNGAVSAGGRR